MESRVKILGHAVHPMLIPFPLGLLATAVVFDVIYAFGGPAEFAIFSFWAIAAGIVTGLVAAVFGLWDWIYVPGGTRAKVIGAWHGGGNVVVVGLFAVAWLLRLGVEQPQYAPGGLALALELLGAGLAVVTGWLGGELVERLGVGVDEGANLDSPSSLSGRPAATPGQASHVHGGD
jgi:uncharacterized membrane protein